MDDRHRLQLFPLECLHTRILITFVKWAAFALMDQVPFSVWYANPVRRENTSTCEVSVAAAVRLNLFSHVSTGHLLAEWHASSVLASGDDNDNLPRHAYVGSMNPHAFLPNPAEAWERRCTEQSP